MTGANKCLYGGPGGKDKCQKHRMYAYPGEKAQFCSLHKKDGMVDVHNKRCEAHGCDKHPTYGLANGRARFCTKHKDPDMVDVHCRPCEFEGCHKHPHYAFEGDKARFCATHKEEGMVDVKHKRCHTPKCRELRVYETPTKKSRFCQGHLNEWLAAKSARRSYNGSGATKTETPSKRTPVRQMPAATMRTVKGAGILASPRANASNEGAPGTYGSRPRSENDSKPMPKRRAQQGATGQPPTSRSRVMSPVSPLGSESHRGSSLPETTFQGGNVSSPTVVRGGHSYTGDHEGNNRRPRGGGRGNAGSPGDSPMASPAVKGQTGGQPPYYSPMAVAGKSGESMEMSPYSPRGSDFPPSSLLVGGVTAERPKRRGPADDMPVADSPGSSRRSTLRSSSAMLSSMVEEQGRTAAGLSGSGSVATDGGGYNPNEPFAGHDGSKYRPGEAGYGGRATGHSPVGANAAASGVRNEASGEITTASAPKRGHRRGGRGPGFGPGPAGMFATFPPASRRRNRGEEAQEALRRVPDWRGEASTTGMSSGMDGHAQNTSTSAASDTRGMPEGSPRASSYAYPQGDEDMRQVYGHYPTAPSGKDGHPQRGHRRGGSFDPNFDPNVEALAHYNLGGNNGDGGSRGETLPRSGHGSLSLQSLGSDSHYKPASFGGGFAGGSFAAGSFGFGSGTFPGLHRRHGRNGSTGSVDFDILAPILAELRSSGGGSIGGASTSSHSGGLSQSALPISPSRAHQHATSSAASTSARRTSQSAPLPIVADPDSPPHTLSDDASTGYPTPKYLGTTSGGGMVKSEEFQAHFGSVGKKGDRGYGGTTERDGAGERDGHAMGRDDDNYASAASERNYFDSLGQSSREQQRWQTQRPPSSVHLETLATAAGHMGSNERNSSPRSGDGNGRSADTGDHNRSDAGVPGGVWIRHPAGMVTGPRRQFLQ